MGNTKQKVSLGSLCLCYLQYVVELGLELKVRFGLDDDSLEGLLQHLHTRLGLLTGVRDTHVLPLTAQSLFFGFVHLREPQETHGINTVTGNGISLTANMTGFIINLALIFIPKHLAHCSFISSYFLKKSKELKRLLV